MELCFFFFFPESEMNVLSDKISRSAVDTNEGNIKHISFSYSIVVSTSGTGKDSKLKCP